MSAEFRAAPIPLARQPAFRLGAVEVTPATSEVTWGDTRETLQPKVMQVLVALATRRGEVVSLDDLIAVCWGGRVVGDDAVQRCIARIRRLAERTGAFAVETIPRVGYRLAVNGAPSRSGASARRRTAVLGALALLAVVGCAAAFWSLGGHTPAEGPRVEVEALRAVDGGPAARFAEVLRDDVVSVLNQSGVQTTADADGPRVLHRPGADLVLKGSVSRQGEQLSVRIFLEDARSDLTLWSGRFDRPVASSQALADEVAVAATETIYTALEPGRYAGRKIDP
ncbi:MAG TPA: winged helix-turn-helix domain-containing protein, partial [Phenylobacterium sp.]